MNRKPAVAGQFYPAGKSQLEEDIAACFRHRLGPGSMTADKTSKPIVAAVVPHAGYVYSGMVAAHVYEKIAAQPPTDVFIILGPNHRGMGAPVALYSDGCWETPLGEVEIDSPLATRLLDNPLIKADKTAHTSEHSLEVQVPFLQTVAHDFTIVPLVLSDQSVATAKALGETLAQTIIEETRRVTLLASSDFSHYVSAKQAYTDDNLAINEILDLRVDSFYKLVRDDEITICGYGPISAIMTAVSRLGASQGKLLKYATSGDVHPMPQVVGYAAITFTNESNE